MYKCAHIHNHVDGALLVALWIPIGRQPKARNFCRQLRYKIQPISVCRLRTAARAHARDARASAHRPRKREKAREGVLSAADEHVARQSGHCGAAALKEPYRFHDLSAEALKMQIPKRWEKDARVVVGVRPLIERAMAFVVLA